MKRATIEEKLDDMIMYFRYLDALRETGITNMFGAGSYLAERFGLKGDDARKVLAQWMETFHRDESPEARAKRVINYGGKKKNERRKQ